MSKLIDDDKIEEQSRSTMFFGDYASSDFKLGFILGSKWTQRKIKPMFLLFIRWCMNDYYTLSEGDTWIPNSLEESRNPSNWKTTEELFELWMEEQQEHTTNRHRGISKESVSLEGGRLAEEHFKQEEYQSEYDAAVDKFKEDWVNKQTKK